MILEEQLKKNKILSKTGAYSINPSSRSIIESLKYTTELLAEKNNAVVIYPQGKISTFVGSNFEFKPGIEKILEKSEQLQLLFYTAFVDYFSERKPTLYLYLGEIEFKHYKLNELQDRYHKFYSQCLSQHVKKES